MPADKKAKENLRQTESVPVDPENIVVPEVIPILPLQGFVFYPGMGFPLQVVNPGSKKLVDEAMESNRLIGMVAHRMMKEKKTAPVPPDHLFNTGTIGYIHKITVGDDGVYQVLVSAFKKIKIFEFTQVDPYHKGKIKELNMVEIHDQEVEALVLNLRDQFKTYAEFTKLPEAPFTDNHVTFKPISCGVFGKFTAWPAP